MTNNQTARLPRSTPESQGIASSAVHAFLDAAERDGVGLHSLMLVRHGNVVAEGWWAPYAPALPHMLFSLSKSFASTAVGFAVSEGRLSVDDTVISFFAEDVPAEIGANLAAMRVRHLLSMSTGHDVDATGATVQAADGNWVRAFLAQPVQHEPGTHFAYNSAATYMLSAIVQRLTGETVLDYLRPRLLEPLGIEGATWESCPRGINIGGWGLNIRTEDIACFGQTYLQEGMWQGKQLIPAAWVREATAWQVSNGSDPESDWAQGYGYQFWRCRHHAYRGDGAFGQFCLVMPGQDAVLAMTSGEGDMQRMLNLVWEHLLPAMQDGALHAGADAQALAARLAALAIAPIERTPVSPCAVEVSGRRYTFHKNTQHLKAVSVTFGEDECTMTIADAAGEHAIACGYGDWRFGETMLERRTPGPVAASGAWTSADTFTVHFIYYTTPFCPRLTLHFDGDRLTYQVTLNVSFEPLVRPALTGHSKH